MLRKGHGGLYKAPIKEERRKRAAKRIESNKIEEKYGLLYFSVRHEL